ncbi:hypothetical protein CUU66_09740 [Peribacillus deserti]|uniref:DUF3784 domain-containing protein n=1 Tax=Peribacillus deserti TaxID=673318 RepID=A0A2N5M6M8_9BACI|nr:hypothetical protein CUU66_09740 [Peribacillus deserti]
MNFFIMMLYLLCGLLILSAGIGCFINTLNSVKNIHESTIAANDILKEFEFGNLIKTLLITFVVVFMITLIFEINDNFVFNVMLPSFFIAGAVESARYLFKRQQNNTNHM